MNYQTKSTVAIDRDGAMLPMLAVVMVILIVTVAIGVDIARMHLTRAELRTANDSAARAAVESLGHSQDAVIAQDKAILVASMNTVAGKGLTLERSQIKLGHATSQPSGSYVFTEGSTDLTSARVTGKRTTDSRDGPVGLLFGPIFGVDEFCADAVSAATQSQRDIGLVLDVSGSMSKEGRFLALADALDIFLLTLQSTPQSENVSLSVYETSSRKLQDLTSDLDLISAAFSRELADGATAIGLGMGQGLDSVLHDFTARPHALKSIVLMTDGNHNTDIDPEVVAQQCAAAHVSVYTITFKNGADQERMRRIAETAGGIHVHAKNNAELEAAFRLIALHHGVVLTE